MNRALIASSVVATLLLTGLGSVSTSAWGPQGHRLVAMLAATQLTPVARQNVQRLLGGQTMADVAVWADEYLVGVNQTAPWHYVNIPPDARSYDRDRDCPRQPGVTAGARGDVWRDCIVDRIRYNQERVADASLDLLDRGIALKFLIHFVGDLHQPLHASAVDRGGNGIQIRAFGAETCGGTPERPAPCNLHAYWDSGMITHVGLTDRQYLARLETIVSRDRLRTRPVGSAAEWAMESLVISNAIMLPQKGDADEAYYRKHIATLDERLALGGVRLAAVINRSLAARVR